MTDIQRLDQDGFEGVRDAFAANFDKHGEVGAAFSAYHRGQKVVDLWGGVADQDTGRRWEEDAVDPRSSPPPRAPPRCAPTDWPRTAGSTSRPPVVDYWPEFAAAGKEAMPVSYLLSHQAGLAWIDGTMTLDEALAWDPVVERLAGEAPKWEPGTAHGYHATTYGWLVGEVVHRITGQSLGTYFRDEVAAPLGLDFWIGLPEAEEPRVGSLISFDLPTEGPGPRAGRPVHGARHQARQGAVGAGRGLHRLLVVRTRARCGRPRSPPPTA